MAAGTKKTLQYLLGYFFDHDVKIGDRKGRKESRPVVAKTRGDKVYKGRLVVLVDSRSASAAEVFARVVQLEKRGTVLGDHTAGAVTEALHFYHQYVRRKGFLVSALAVTYGVSVTVNNLIMTDGKSLDLFRFQGPLGSAGLPRQVSGPGAPDFYRLSLSNCLL